MTDSQAYLDKRKFFDRILTIYGRKPVLEAMQSRDIKPYKLHLADSNRSDGTLAQIESLAKKTGTETLYHSREALSRISKNRKQDQGVALDIELAKYQHVDDIDQLDGKHFIALDRVTNPQNIGMIIRSVAASGCAGLILPKEGCAQLGPLVIKASAGALFKAPIYRCDKLSDALTKLADLGAKITALELDASHDLKSLPSGETRVFVLGNETDGVSPQISKLANDHVKIEMHNGVESLNVAVTAALLCFYA